MSEERKSTEPEKIQWHPAFVSAMNLELAQDRQSLIFEREYNLNMKPLEIDLLIIKKEKKVRIRNEVGYLFRLYNILEYKSPDDRLNIDTYYKAVAYGCLYKAYGKAVNEVKAKDITVSILRDAKPNGLFGYFKEAGTTITHPYPGIYYLSGEEIFFPTQIIVTKELTEENHAYLRLLTKHPKKNDISRFLKLFQNFKQKADREFAESVLEVFTAANKKWMSHWKGDSDMSPALLELMEPELQEAKKISREEGWLEGREEGRIQGIYGTVNILRNLRLSQIKIKEIIMDQFALSEEEAERFL